MVSGGLADERALEDFERYLERFLHGHASGGPLAQQIAHHFGAEVRRGKRLRPRLVLAAAASLGAELEDALPACAAIELLHNYSLIHDDIEDGDRLRRGRETLWAKFGVAHGINAGDAVGALAYAALQETGRLDAAVTQAMLGDLARAHVRMCEGQALDLAAEGAAQVTPAEYLEMIEGKTAALFACAASLGARCASLARAHEAEVERCAEFGRLFGLGFQIRDDVLGIWGPRESTGKNSSGDIARRKHTYPIVWAASHDAEGAGRTVARVYAQGGAAITSADIEEVRAALERGGARAAAEAAASDYFARASAYAGASEALRRFVDDWSAPAA